MTNEGTVLLVDDHDPTLGGLQRLLETATFTVHATTKAEEVALIAARHPPDAVLLDVMMPGINGIDVCAQLKQHHATRLTPIVLMTGTHARAVRMEGLAQGADDVLTKPLDIEELE